MYTHNVHCVHCYNVIHPCELLLLKEKLSNDAYVHTCETMDHYSVGCSVILR